MSHNEVAEFGEQVAIKLWGAKLVERGSHEDRQGVDGYMNDGSSIQVKADQIIVRTGNLYHEIYEKSIDRPDQKWRHSPNNAQIIIFVTKGISYKVATNDLALAENGLTLEQISETSMGFLVPLDRIKNYEKRMIMNVGDFY